ncbi:hypothetical protein OG579_17105 [Williamsia herbipolensis]|uniref:Uncharacterized protein n=1 Tax=Williamsia herbipolensis TaxID=1603258 RepID=A0AAU4K026_9NOCA|nr:hypothetical protein [Williamsia herbipolensis]
MTDPQMVNPGNVECSEYAIAGQLLALFVDELATTRGGPPDIAVVHPGAQVPHYGCDIATVTIPRVGQAPGGNQLGRTKLARERLVLCAMSMIRCYRSTDRNDMPPPAVLDSATRDVLDDLHAMRTAVREFSTLTGLTVIVGDWRAVGPQGGLHGGELSVQIAAGMEDAPPDAIVPMLDGDPRKQ